MYSVSAICLFDLITKLMNYRMKQVGSGVGLLQVSFYSAHMNHRGIGGSDVVQDSRNETVFLYHQYSPLS